MVLQPWNGDPRFRSGTGNSNSVLPVASLFSNHQENTQLGYVFLQLTNKASMKPEGKSQGPQGAEWCCRQMTHIFQNLSISPYLSIFLDTIAQWPTIIFLSVCECGTGDWAQGSPTPANTLSHLYLLPSLIASLDCQLDTMGKEGPELKNIFRQTVL